MLTFKKLHSIIQNVTEKNRQHKVHWKVNNKLWETNKAVVFNYQNKEGCFEEIMKLWFKEITKMSQRT